MSSLITRFLIENLDIRGAAVHLDDAWQAITRDCNYPQPVAELLGELCAMTALLAANIKQDGRLTFQLSGQGPVSLLVIDCTADLNLRGYAKFAELPAGKPGLSALLGDGQLLMTLDLAAAPQPYQSYVPLQGESLSEVFCHFLAQSEQQPAWLRLQADAQHAAGFFVQKLPDADRKDADGWNRVTVLAETLRKDELASADHPTMLGRIFPEEDVRAYAARPVSHNFPPQREKVLAMLKSFGAEEVERLKEADGAIQVRDDLSNIAYRFEAAELAGLFG